MEPTFSEKDKQDAIKMLTDVKVEAEKLVSVLDEALEVIGKNDPQQIVEYFVNFDPEKDLKYIRIFYD